MLDPHKVPLPLSDAHREWFLNNNGAHHLEEGGVLHARLAEASLEAEDEPDKNNAPDEGVDYNSWTVPDLKAEIERRNSEMSDEDEPLSTSGKKGDLVALLIADDEALAEGSA